MKKLSYILSLLIVFSACSSQQELFIDAKKHMLESQKLQRLIHNLDVVEQNEVNSELEKDDKKYRYALTLADTINTLSQKIENASFNEEKQSDKNEYLKQSQLLFDYANDIKTTAQNYEFEKLPYILEQVNKTCLDCHHKYKTTR